MIRLHYSNRLDALIAPLADAVGIAQRFDPLAPLEIVVPNRVVEQFIKFKLAEEIGVAANLRFPFLRVFLRKLMETAEPSIRIVDADDLQIILFEALRSPNALANSSLKPAIDYIRASTAEPADRETRAMDLAGRVAALFREYSISRQRMLASWRRGSRSVGPAFEETEIWQSQLWTTIFDDRRCLRREFLTNPDERWMLLPDAIAAIDSVKLRAALRGPLHIFGLAYVGTAFAQMFERLAHLGDVAVYALNPCLEFWEDVDTSRRIDRDGWIRRGSKVGDAINDSEDPFNLSRDDTLALQYWGRPGREYIRLLNELADCEFDPHFVEPGARDGAPILARIHQDILLRHPPGDPVAAQSGMADDGSIRFLACPSVPREVEIIANKIWWLIKNDDSVNADAPLRFHEIAVAIPDAVVDAYLPHIEAAFGRSHSIPIDIVPRRYAGQSRVAEAIELILDLPLGRFTRQEMLHLLTHPAIAGRDAEADAERWPAWARTLGVYLGADDNDLRDTYIRGLYHWDQALKRLALGMFLEEAHGDAPRFYAPREGDAYLPLDLPQGELDSVARIVRIARGLLENAMRMRSERMSLKAWARLLVEVIATHVAQGKPTDERMRTRCLEAIESIAHEHLATQPVPYQVVRNLLAGRIASLEAVRSRLSGRGVAVGSLSALQSLPFKVIFALGLGEGTFPERDRRDPLDLRGARRVAGDVSPADRDRYLFLQSILAAREKIFLSYVARDAQTGDSLEPSSALLEFQTILRSYVDQDTLDEKLTINHRMSPNDFQYFSALQADAPSDLAREGESFDPDAHSGARMAALRRDLARHAASDAMPARGEPMLSRLSEPVADSLRHQLRIIDLPPRRVRESTLEEIRVPVSALKSFLECPLQGAARYALGMEREESEEPAEDEPLGLSRLDHTILLRNVFWKADADEVRMAEDYRRAFRVAQMHGQAPAGSFAAAAEIRDVLRLKRWCGQLAQAGIESIQGWDEIRLGPADEFSTATRILAPLTLDVTVNPAHGGQAAQRVVIYGSLGHVSPARDLAMQGIMRPKSKPRDFIAMILSAIVLAATGEPMPPVFNAILLCAAEKPCMRPFAVPNAEAARAYLSVLLADLLSGENFYFFPVEAAEKFYDDLKKPADKRDLQQDLENMRELVRPSCASDYGPIRNARRFEPPDDAAIAKIMARRYKLIETIFTKEK
jgi:exodeoxyribonuclease V gamma subunit